MLSDFFDEARIKQSKNFLFTELSNFLKNNEKTVFKCQIGYFEKDEPKYYCRFVIKKENDKYNLHIIILNFKDHIPHINENFISLKECVEYRFLDDKNFLDLIKDENTYIKLRT